MYAKVIVLSVLATLLVVASVLALAFVLMPRFSYRPQVYGLGRSAYGPGYGPGMMGGMMNGNRTGGMMNGGMMRGGITGAPGYWNTPVAPNRPSDSPAAPPSSSDVAPTSTPAPSNPPTTNRSRGGIVGSGQTSSGRLIAVTPNGEALPVDSDNKLPANTAAQKVGNLNVSLALSPFPPAGFSTSNFDVTLTDENGQPITDAKISLNLTMPTMWMPTNTPAAQHVGNGRYQATGRFTMRGLWRIEVKIDGGGSARSAFFDVWL